MKVQPKVCCPTLTLPSRDARNPLVHGLFPLQYHLEGLSAPPTAPRGAMGTADISGRSLGQSRLCPSKQPFL